MELVSGLTFSDWEAFKRWLDMFAIKKGFNYKLRTSEMDEGTMRRATYECSRSGTYNPRVTTDPTKRRNVSSQQTQCPWKLNVTYPKTSTVVKINSFIDEHNHPFTTMICKIAPRFRKLTD